MTKRALALAALLLTLTTLTAPLAAEPLPSDSRILTGTLDNGVKWMYRQHDNPPGKMSLMIHVDAGSLNEVDEQQGLAHFMEHMMFNGTEHFPPGELVPFFERIGMEFGADLNAFTGFDQTVYMLFIPDTKTETIDESLMVLSDYAFRALLLEEEIDKERGVIMAELRSGMSPQQRMRDKLWPELFEGSRFAHRMPIGKEEVITGAPRSEFVEFYQTWYRPENVTVLLVGDRAPDDVIPLVKKWFGDYKSPLPPQPAPGPEFKPFNKPRGIIVTDPEMTSCELMISNLRPARPPVTTVEQWRDELVEGIGGWIIGRRYRERVDKGEATYREASAGVHDFFGDATLVEAVAEGEPMDWHKIVDEVVAEIKRAREFGFTQHEMELVRKEIIAGAERSVRTESTRPARSILMAILSAVNDGVPVLSAQQELDLCNKILPTIELAEVNKVFTEHFTPGTFACVLQMPEKEDIEVPTRDELLAAARQAWEQEVTAPKAKADAGDLLAVLPTPGKVVESTIDADLGITSAWLSNGVRVHHRFMDYKKDAVSINMALAGGTIEETKDNAGVTSVAMLAFRQPATNRLASTDIRDLMTGKNIRVGGGGRGMRAGGDSFDLSIQGSPEDLEAGLQLAHALLTDGVIEQSAFDNWKLESLQRLERMKTMPQFQAMQAMADLLSNGDPRRMFTTEDIINHQTIEEGQAWYNRLCRTAPIEVAIVGDITLEDAMPLIERYLGSLPKRDRSPSFDGLRKTIRAEGPLSRHVEVETITPQSIAMAGFVAAEGRAVQDRRALELASQILSTRLIKSIREDQGLVYSIGAMYRPSWIYDDSAQFMAGAPCEPGKAELVAEQVHAMFDEFAEQGPTEEELSNAKKQVANNLDTQMREPGYWADILEHYDLHGRSLADEKVEKEAFEAITGDQVRDAVRKYNQPARRFTVTAVPTKPAEE
ncbi:MAG: insulinase family protein [Phycisphaerae bacterium]|nr:insulinase family protein [Phycisphaerae bacterium]